MGQNGDYLIAQGLGDSREDKKESAIIAGGDQTIADYFKSMKIIPKKTFRLGWVDSLLPTKPWHALENQAKFSMYGLLAGENRMVGPSTDKEECLLHTGRTA
jgi:hypothetical protein